MAGASGSWDNENDIYGTSYAPQWDEDIDANWGSGYSSPTFTPNTFTPNTFTPNTYTPASYTSWGNPSAPAISGDAPYVAPTFGYFGAPGGGSNDSEFYNLPNRQANAAMNMGERVAELGDPAQSYRPSWAKMLDETIKGEGSFSSSPAYQFAYNQGLEAVNRKYAKDLGSGARGQALQDYGMNAASQLRGSEIDRLGRLTGSPGASATAMAKMYQDAWDRQQMALANKNQVQNPRQQAPVQRGQSGMNTLTDMYRNMNSGGYSGSGGGSGGYGGGYNSYSGAVDDPTSAGWINTASGPMQYTPSSLAGTGFVQSDSGLYDFGSNVSFNDSFYVPGGQVSGITPETSYFPSTSAVDQYLGGSGYDYGYNGGSNYGGGYSAIDQYLDGSNYDYGGGSNYAFDDGYYWDE